jgi:hypothetical protein
MDEAADEIERLRLSSRGHCPAPENAADEDKVFSPQNMTTLTDAERTAIKRLIEDYETDREPANAGCVATLRGLLERLGGAT